MPYVHVGQYVINNQLRDIFFKTSDSNEKTDIKYRYYIPWKKNKGIRFFIGTNVKIQNV